jgi:hypothetical protein
MERAMHTYDRVVWKHAMMELISTCIVVIVMLLTLAERGEKGFLGK